MAEQDERAAFEAWFADFRHGWKTEKDVAFDAFKAGAALAATPAPAPQWQPIETAPTDHFPRLLRVRGLTMQGFRDVAGHWNVQTETSPHWRKLRGKPTHWMPLPAKPEAGQGKEASNAP